MKRTILLLLSFTLILINSQSGMSEKNQIDFFNRQHYRKSVKEFTYKDPLPYIKQGEKTGSYFGNRRRGAEAGNNRRK